MTRIVTCDIANGKALILSPKGGTVKIPDLTLLPSAQLDLLKAIGNILSTTLHSHSYDHITASFTRVHSAIKLFLIEDLLLCFFMVSIWSSISKLLN
jgi:hypothetical protein